MSRAKWYRSLAVLYVWEQKAWADDRKFTAEDIDETVLALLALGWIWKGNVALAAVPGINIVEGIVATGAVASLAIGGVEGLENYVEFITEPAKIPERVAFTAETIYQEVIEEPLAEAASWYVDFIDEGIRAVRLGWKISQPPGFRYLPF